MLAHSQLLACPSLAPLPPRPRAQHEPLRLHKSWGTALLFFAVWDACLLALAWWACGHFGGAGPLQQHKVRRAGGSRAWRRLAEGLQLPAPARGCRVQC